METGVDRLVSGDLLLLIKHNQQHMQRSYNVSHKFVLVIKYLGYQVDRGSLGPGKLTVLEVALKINVEMQGMLYLLWSTWRQLWPIVLTSSVTVDAPRIHYIKSMK